MSDTAFLVSAVMYIPAFVASVAQCVILTRRQSSERHKLWRPITFFALLALSFFARVVWFFLRAAGSNNFGDHIVNRIALLAFFGGFVVYVLGWAEVLDAKWLPRLNRIALVSNIVFATLIFVSSVVAAALTGSTRDAVYDANIGVIVVMFLVLALLFVYLCLKLRRRLLSVFKAVNSVLAVSAARKILIATVVCVVCFLERSIFWLYEPVTDDTLGVADKYLYPWVYYNVPELVPGIAMMLLIAPSTTASRKGAADGGGRSSSNINAGAGIGGRKSCCWWCGGAQAQQDAGFGSHHYRTGPSSVEVHNPVVAHRDGASAI